MADQTSSPQTIVPPPCPHPRMRSSGGFANAAKGDFRIVGAICASCEKELTDAEARAANTRSMRMSGAVQNARNSGQNQVAGLLDEADKLATRMWHAEIGRFRFAKELTELVGERETLIPKLVHFGFKEEAIREFFLIGDPTGMFAHLGAEAGAKEKYAAEAAQRQQKLAQYEASQRALPQSIGGGAMLLTAGSASVGGGAGPAAGPEVRVERDITQPKPAVPPSPVASPAPRPPPLRSASITLADGTIPRSRVPASPVAAAAQASATASPASVPAPAQVTAPAAIRSAPEVEDASFVELPATPPVTPAPAAPAQAQAQAQTKEEQAFAMLEQAKMWAEAAQRMMEEARGAPDSPAAQVGPPAPTPVVPAAAVPQDAPGRPAVILEPAPPAAMPAPTPPAETTQALAVQPAAGGPGTQLATSSMSAGLGLALSDRCKTCDAPVMKGVLMCNRCLKDNGLLPKDPKSAPPPPAPPGMVDPRMGQPGVVGMSVGPSGQPMPVMECVEANPDLLAAWLK